MFDWTDQQSASLLDAAPDGVAAVGADGTRPVACGPSEKSFTVYWS